MLRTWSSGTWRTSRDTIYLRIVDVFDTLTRTDQPDSLVTSWDEKVDRISNEEFLSTRFSPGGQNNVDMPERLFRKGERLFIVDRRGRLIKKRRSDVNRWKRYPAWYNKVD